MSLSYLAKIPETGLGIDGATDAQVLMRADEHGFAGILAKHAAEHRVAAGLGYGVRHGVELQVQITAEISLGDRERLAGGLAERLQHLAEAHDDLRVGLGIQVVQAGHVQPDRGAHWLPPCPVGGRPTDASREVSDATGKEPGTFPGVGREILVL